MACTVCTHPQNEAIDEAIVAGQSHRSIAREFGLNRYAVDRHARNHLSQALSAVRSGKSRALLERIEIVVGRIEELADAAHEKGRANQLIAASRELRELYRLMGKVTGELDDRPQVVNVLVDPTWLAIRTGMLRALEPHPDARATLADYLEHAPRGLPS